ncbi:hypothetical protein RB195_013109 [Necator americanus]|uniref:Uncharacterized protein n=1 Tax=Necator americanus TaxID=51031 RepID=A0ABR1DU13_NECAM
MCDKMSSNNAFAGSKQHIVGLRRPRPVVMAVQRAEDNERSLNGGRVLGGDFRPPEVTGTSIQMSDAAAAAAAMENWEENDDGGGGGGGGESGPGHRISVDAEKRCVLDDIIIGGTLEDNDDDDEDEIRDLRGLFREMFVTEKKFATARHGEANHTLSAAAAVVLCCYALVGRHHHKVLRPVLSTTLNSPNLRRG